MFAIGKKKMVVKDVYEFLNKIAPFNSAAEFDNVGLLIGSMEKEVEKILVCLDLSTDVLNQAKNEKIDLIVSHHPVIFKNVKQILEKDLIYDVVKSEISVICAHTNLDIAKDGVSNCLAESLDLFEIEILKDSENFGRIGKLKEELSCDEFIKKVSKNLKTTIKAVRTTKKIKKVAVVSGAGENFLELAIKNCADAFVTGESRHHILIEAREKNFCLIDAGHFATEKIVCEKLKKILQREFKNCSFVNAAEENLAVFCRENEIWQ